MENERFVVVVGAGAFEERLLQAISKEWKVVVIDIRRERIESLQSKLPELQCIHGDATSRLTWTGLSRERVHAIIVAIGSESVALETCRVIRESFNDAVPLVAVHDGPWDNTAFRHFGVDIIQPAEIGLQVIHNRIRRKVARAVTVGLGMGELLEITILSPSHLIERKLKHLRPSRWAVSALYREGQLIVPTGETMLKIGDRVLLVGDPNVLEHVAAILNRGVPQFPLQFGENIVVPFHARAITTLSETSYWIESTRAKRFYLVPVDGEPPEEFLSQLDNTIGNFQILQKVNRFSDIFPVNASTGLLLISGDTARSRNRIRLVFQKGRVPFLIARGSHPYSSITVSLNNHNPALALQITSELARLMNIPFDACYVALPKELRGREEEEELALRREIVNDFSHILHADIRYEVRDGNPVKETLKLVKSLKPQTLIITVGRLEESTGLFNRNVPFRLAAQCDRSVLVIPEMIGNA